MPLTPADIKRLRALLPRELSEHDAQGLLAFSRSTAALCADLVLCDRSQAPSPPRSVCAARLEHAARACRAVIAATDALDGGADAHADLRECVEAEAVEFERQAAILRKHPYRRLPHDLIAMLVIDIATHYMQATGKPPPVAEGSWFPDFCAALGKAHGLVIGARLVRAGVREARERRRPAGVR